MVWRQRRVVGVFTTCTATVLMLAWHARWTIVLTMCAGLSPIQYNAAVLFLLTGIDMSLPTILRSKHRALPSIIVTLAAVTLAQDITPIEAQVDILLHSPYLTDVPSPGRMAPSAAICFICYGIGRFRRLGDYSLIGLGISGLAAVGYATETPDLYHWSPGVTPIAMPAALMFVVVFASEHWSRRTDLLEFKRCSTN